MLLMMLLTTATAWAQGVDYIDANGVVKNTATDDIDGNDNPTVLTGGEATTLSAGWYVVNSDINYTGTITLTDDVTIILADGKTMNVGTSESRISGHGLRREGDESASLTIYGQSLDDATAGTLNIYTTGGHGIMLGGGIYTQHSGNVVINTNGDSNAISTNRGGFILNGGNLVAQNTINAYDCDIVINGGKLDAKYPGNATNRSAIYSNYTITMTGGTVTATATNQIGIRGKVTFSGGTLTATGSVYGIRGQATISWTSATDRFTASSYSSTVTIADGQSFHVGSDIYSGMLSSGDKTAIAGQTLVPYGMTIAANLVDGNYWTTLYRGDAGFSIVAEENACAYTATVSDATITLHKLGKVIPQGTAVIIVGEDDEIGMTTSTADAEYTVSNDLHGVDVATPLTTVKSTYGADAILVLSNKNSKFGFHELATTNVPARKAFLPVNDSSGARELTMVFEDVMGIRSIDNGPLTIDHSADAWYTLDGRRLSGKPMAKGVYVHSGRKVVIK